MIEGVDQLKKAVDDAEVDKEMVLKEQIEAMVPFMLESGNSLEAAGAGIMKRERIVEIGEKFVLAAGSLEALALGIQKIGAGDLEETKISGQRMLYAAEKMKEAGNNLMGIAPEKKKGKGWLKG